MMLDAPAAAPPPVIEEPDAMVRLVAGALLGREAREIPEWMLERAPRFVAITARPSGEPPRRANGSGGALWPALADAAAKLRSMGVRPGAPPRFRVEIADQFSAPTYSRFGFWRGATVGVDGLAFLQSSGVVLFPLEILAANPEDVANALSPVSLLKIIPVTQSAGPLRKRLGTLREVPVRTFRASAFYSDGGGPAVPLSGGHEAIAPLTRERLAEALDLAADAYARIVKNDGEFVYLYDPATGAEAGDYNLPRHGGALWALAELADHTGREDLKDAARRSARALLRYRRRFGQSEALCLVREDSVKLGSVALGALALARCVEVTGHAFLTSPAEQLGEMLVLAQDDTGRFVSKYSYPDFEPNIEWESDYYPGEAALALLALHRLTGAEKWLDAAENGVRYLVEVRDEGKAPQDLLHDHWLLMALDALDRVRPDRQWVEYTAGLSQAIVRAQNLDPRAPWRFGAFQERNDLTPAACRVEGLSAAWRLLKRAGRDSEADAVRDCIGLAAAFLVRMQYRDASTLDFKDPDYLKGQFPGGVGRPECRNDFIQHNVSGLLGALDIMEKEGLGVLSPRP